MTFNRQQLFLSQTAYRQQCCACVSSECSGQNELVPLSSANYSDANHPCSLTDQRSKGQCDLGQSRTQKSPQYPVKQRKKHRYMKLSKTKTL